MINLSKNYALAITAAAMLCLTASEKLVAESPDASANITFTATGTFATPQLSGGDLFKLVGEPFTISVVVNSAATPSSHGTSWAKYTKLPMTGVISTALTPTPYDISTKNASIELATGNPSYDTFAMFATVSVVGTPINVTATIQLPPGTLTKPLVHTFAPVALKTADTVIYAETTGTPPPSTTLAIASGTIQGTIPTGGVDRTAAASVELLSAGSRVVTAHADGTKLVRPIGTTAVELGESSDKVALQFYASGVREGSEIHVQIAGHEVPVLHAGPAGYFPGLDEITVMVPHSLAGSGNVDVDLMVDGRSATPVHIQIQ